MNGEIKRIVWLPEARDEFKKLIQYIKKDSIQNSEKVKQDIKAKITGLIKYPERYSPDRFKLLNTDNNFRAFEMHSIRIAYFVDVNQIMIIRVRHVKRESLFY